jgi:ricin-type beta-trefoil lectin protein
MKKIMLITFCFLATYAQVSAAEYFFLVAKHSGKCVHQAGATQGNGDPITQWDCVNQPNVQWKFRKEPASSNSGPSLSPSQSSTESEYDRRIRENKEKIKENCAKRGGVYKEYGTGAGCDY